MSAIPDRWIPYKACGEVIEGTRMICFKVPLRKTVQQHNKEIKEIWDVPSLLSKIPTLGAVIDLTNTSRYYNPTEFTKKGVLHKKILMPGRVIPPDNKVKEFMDAVDELLGKDCDYLLGVHCTHGLNRTGYMVCRYMRDRLGIPAQDAIERFEKARGYKIERENYKADLLGKMPPPPDVGKSITKVTPLHDDYEVKTKKRRYGNKELMKAKHREIDEESEKDNRNKRKRVSDSTESSSICRNKNRDQNDSIANGNDSRTRSIYEFRSKDFKFDYSFDY